MSTGTSKRVEELIHATPREKRGYMLRDGVPSDLVTDLEPFFRQALEEERAGEVHRAIANERALICAFLQRPGLNFDGLVHLIKVGHHYKTYGSFDCTDEAPTCSKGAIEPEASVRT